MPHLQVVFNWMVAVMRAYARMAMLIVRAYVRIVIGLGRMYVRSLSCIINAGIMSAAACLGVAGALTVAAVALIGATAGRLHATKEASKKGPVPATPATTDRPLYEPADSSAVLQDARETVEDIFASVDCEQQAQVSGYARAPASTGRLPLLHIHMYVGLLMHAHMATHQPQAAPVRTTALPIIPALLPHPVWSLPASPLSDSTPPAPTPACCQDHSTALAQLAAARGDRNKLSKEEIAAARAAGAAARASLQQKLDDTSTAHSALDLAGRTQWWETTAAVQVTDAPDACGSGNRIAAADWDGLDDEARAMMAAILAR